MKKQILFHFFLLLSSVDVFSQKSLKEIDSFVQKILNDWKIPGIAIGIIKDDSIYLNKGYGYRNLEQKLPVTSQTLFPIASVTKSFTGIDLCLLEEEGKVNLQSPVKSYIPAFALYNNQLTNETTLIDLLSHRTGLPSHDALWWSTDKTREQLFQSLKYLQPNKQFREAWQYSNLSYMTSGYILQLVSGESWESYTQEKILKPLEMTNTNFSVKNIQASSNFSYPYKYINGNIQRITFRNLDAVAPCGGIVSSVEDMLKYVQMLVQKGKYKDKQIIPERVLAKAEQPVVIMPYTGTNGSASVYGLGFQQETFDKYLLIEHRGEIDGFTSILTLVPEMKIGIIILANTDVVQPTGIIRNRLLEHLLKLAVTDENTNAVKGWMAYTQHEQKESLTKVQKILDSDDRIKGTHPSHALEAYTGEYTNPGYGTIKVEKDGDDLKIIRYDYQSKLSHYHYDYFLTNELFPFYRTTFEFKTNGDGFIDQLVIQMETKVDPITFTKEK